MFNGVQFAYQRAIILAWQLKKIELCQLMNKISKCPTYPAYLLKWTTCFGAVDYWLDRSRRDINKIFTDAKYSLHLEMMQFYQIMNYIEENPLENQPVETLFSDLINYFFSEPPTVIHDFMNKNIRRNYLSESARYVRELSLYNSLSYRVTSLPSTILYSIFWQEARDTCVGMKVFIDEKLVDYNQLKKKRKKKEKKKSYLKYYCFMMVLWMIWWIILKS